MKIEDALEDYQLSLLTKSGKYQTWVDDKLHTFVDWCKKNDIDLDTFRPKHFTQFLHELATVPSEKTGKSLSSYTVHGYAQVVKVFLNWTVEEEDYAGLVSQMTLNKCKMPRVLEKVIETFSEEQLGALLTACKKERYPSLRRRNRLIVLLLMDTGIRLGEIRTLKVEDVCTDPRDPYIKVTGKGMKERTIKMGLTTTREMVAYLRVRGRTNPKRSEVFLTRSGKQIGERGLEMMIEQLGERAGITGVRCSPHTFRHTYALNFMRDTHDVYTLSKNLGHTRVAVTENYLKCFRLEDARTSSSTSLADKVR